MKTLLCLIALTSAALGGDQYDDLLMRDGTVLKAAEVKEVTAAGLKIAHKDGVGFYTFEEVPEMLRKKYAAAGQEKTAGAAKKQAPAEKPPAKETPAAAPPAAAPPVEVARAIVPGMTRDECVAAWGKFETEHGKEMTDWTVAGMSVTATWQEGKLSRVDIIAPDKSWTEIATALKMNGFQCSAATTLTPLRHSWKLSNGATLKWNVKGALSKQGAHTYKGVILTP